MFRIQCIRKLGFLNNNFYVIKFALWWTCCSACWLMHDTVCYFAQQCQWYIIFHMYNKNKLKWDLRTRISKNSYLNGLHIFQKGELHIIYYEVSLMSYFIIYVKNKTIINYQCIKIIIFEHLKIPKITI